MVCIPGACTIQLLARGSDGGSNEMVAGRRTQFVVPRTLTVPSFDVSNMSGIPNRLATSWSIYRRPPFTSGFVLLMS